MSQLTFKEFKQKLVERIESKGLAKSLKAQLRIQLIEASKLQDKHIESQKPHSLQQRLLNMLIAEYLNKSGFKYTFSIFIPEVGLKSYECQPLLSDVLNIMKINPSYMNRTSLENIDYPDCILSQLISSISSSDKCKADSACQYEESDNMSMATKLKEIDNKFQTSKGNFQSNSHYSTDEYIRSEIEIKRKEVMEDLQNKYNNEIEKIRIEEHTRYLEAIKHEHERIHSELNIKKQELEKNSQEEIHIAREAAQRISEEIKEERIRLQDSFQRLSERESQFQQKLSLKDNVKIQEKDSIYNPNNNTQVKESNLEPIKKISFTEMNKNSSLPPTNSEHHEVTKLHERLAEMEAKLIAGEKNKKNSSNEMNNKGEKIQALIAELVSEKDISKSNSKKQAEEISKYQQKLRIAENNLFTLHNSVQRTAQQERARWKRRQLYYQREWSEKLSLLQSELDLRIESEESARQQLEEDNLKNVRLQRQLNELQQQTYESSFCFQSSTPINRTKLSSYSNNSSNIDANKLSGHFPAPFFSTASPFPEQHPNAVKVPTTLTQSTPTFTSHDNAKQFLDNNQTFDRVKLSRSNDRSSTINKLEIEDERLSNDMNSFLKLSSDRRNELLGKINSQEQLNNSLPPLVPKQANPLMNASRLAELQYEQSKAQYKQAVFDRIGNNQLSSQSNSDSLDCSFIYQNAISTHINDKSQKQELKDNKNEKNWHMDNVQLQDDKLKKQEEFDNRKQDEINKQEELTAIEKRKIQDEEMQNEINKQELERERIEKRKIQEDEEVSERIENKLEEQKKMREEEERKREERKREEKSKREEESKQEERKREEMKRQEDIEREKIHKAAMEIKKLQEEVFTEAKEVALTRERLKTFKLPEPKFEPKVTENEENKREQERIERERVRELARERRKNDPDISSHEKIKTPPKETIPDFLKGYTDNSNKYSEPDMEFSDDDEELNLNDNSDDFDF